MKCLTDSGNNHRETMGRQPLRNHTPKARSLATIKGVGPSIYLPARVKALLLYMR